MLGQAVEFSVAGWLLRWQWFPGGEAGEIKGKEPSHKNRPSARGSMASGFLTGRTGEEFPQIHKDSSKDTGQHKMKEFDGWLVAMVTQ